MSEDVAAEDRCPHCRFAFEIICVKFELAGTRTLAVCPNCSQVQSVTARNNNAAVPTGVGAKTGQTPSPRLSRRLQIRRGSQSDSRTVSVHLSTSAGAIVLKWLRLKSAQ